MELKGTNDVNVVVPVELNAKQGLTEVNILTSVYSRKNSQGEIQQDWFDDNFFKKNNTVYMNKEKVANFYGSARLQLPLDGRNFDDFFLKVRNLYQSAGLQLPMEGKAFQDLFGSSIKTEEDLVKLKNQKGKSSLMIFDRHFLARGYYVATIGNVNESTIVEYIKNQ